MSRLTPFGFLFGKSLTDLIRGIRRHADEDQRDEYLRGVVSECREEVRSANIDVKSQAILKLAYLEMLGIDMSWAGFHVIEVMASPNFQQKRVGYMAASQCFRSDDELKMLVTNLLKMDLVNQNSATVGAALSGLATIVSPGLASDVADDIMRMLSHSRPYIRKKAVLALYNIIMQYPEALPSAIKRFGDLLDDTLQDISDSGNVSVACATVSVICELAVRAESIQDFLELTPRLYNLFNVSEHNWTIIKLLKIFQLFTSREARLKSRLLPAVRNLMIESRASSLVYECMKCILQGNMLDEDDYVLAQEVARHLCELMNHKDANLKYLTAGLFCDLANINREYLPPKVVLDLIKNRQNDPATRKKVLQLATSVIDDDNLFDIIQDLSMQFKSIDNWEYKRDIAHAISNIGAVNNYQFVPDFEWYIEVLGEVTAVIADSVISKRLLDIVLRVKDLEVRESVSKLCFRWLQKGFFQYTSFIENGSNGNSEQQNQIDPAFSDTCWWIVGEYVNSEILSDPYELVNLVSSTTNLDDPIIISTLVKITAKFAGVTTNTEAVDNLLVKIIEILTGMSYSLNYEVQERACQFLELLKLAKSSPDQQDALLQNGLSSLFQSSELGPIAPGSQKRLGIPDDLDLNTPIEVPALSLLPSELDSDEVSSDVDDYEEDFGQNTSNGYDIPGDSPEDAARHEAERQLYNLSHLSKLSLSDNKSDNLEPKKKPIKKKVLIASDETVEETISKPTKTGSSKSHDRPRSTKLPREASPASASGSTNELPPVKVKHKKKKKKEPKYSGTEEQTIESLK